MTDLTQWPEKICVSGLPLHLAGWNGIFTRADLDDVYRGLFWPPTLIDDLSDGVPQYFRSTHAYGGVIPVETAEISRKDGVWRLGAMRELMHEPGGTKLFECFRTSSNDTGVQGMLGKWPLGELRIDAAPPDAPEDRRAWCCVPILLFCCCQFGRI